MKNFQSLRKIVTSVFFILVAIFFVYYFRNIDFDAIKDIELDYPSLSVGIFVLVAVRYWLSFTWSQMLKMLGVCSFSFADSNYVYAKSWLGRYIPGKVAWILGKIYFASEYGVAKSKLSISSLLEAGVQVAVALLIGVALVFFAGAAQLSFELKLFMGVSSVGVVVALIPVVFNRIVVLVYKLVKNEELRFTGYDSKLLLKLIGYYIFSGLLSGISFFFIVNAFSDVGIDNLLYLIGISNLSGAIGILAIIAPSGIGVREGVQLVCLQPILTDEVLVVVLIAGRTLSILADILFYFTSLMLKLYNEK
ncbi:conserved membrane protein of unknown function [Shewanella benthica]|uniref:Uncharacterized protein n=1 Tax=Shewanella benthica TaxID=43661 RepID=A0A330M4G8_9GAMM|nr:lysylphosphatidylglycerol synthase domain-containing protein [Shewanella benthica]SQH76835.1 conserved membrane protein of unknown function [Shewanella benthica]